MRGRRRRSWDGVGRMARRGLAVHPACGQTGAARRHRSCRRGSRRLSRLSSKPSAVPARPAHPFGSGRGRWRRAAVVVLPREAGPAQPETELPVHPAAEPWHVAQPRWRPLVACTTPAWPSACARRVRSTSIDRRRTGTTDTGMWNCCCSTLTMASGWRLARRQQAGLEFSAASSDPAAAGRPAAGAQPNGGGGPARAGPVHHRLRLCPGAVEQGEQAVVEQVEKARGAGSPCWGTRSRTYPSGAAARRRSARAQSEEPHRQARGARSPRKSRVGQWRRRKVQLGLLGE